jgi:hypothetical protein
MPCRYLSGLPLGSDLLQSGPKGGIKKKGPAWVVGKPKAFGGTHRDGLPLNVTLQVGAARCLPQQQFYRN